MRLLLADLECDDKSSLYCGKKRVPFLRSDGSREATAMQACCPRRTPKGRLAWHTESTGCTRREA